MRTRHRSSHCARSQYLRPNSMTNSTSRRNSSGAAQFFGMPLGQSLCELSETVIPDMRFRSNLVELWPSAGTVSCISTLLIFRRRKVMLPVSRFVG
jgi:hypothetical protein